MSDLIDRQEAIDALAKVAGVGNRALDAIRALPTAEMSDLAIDGNALMEAFYNTPKEAQDWSHAWWLINHAKLAKPKSKKGKWIPVTERLPEEGEMVLFTEGDEYPYTVIVGCIERGKWEYRDDMSTALKPEPIAWMPLPDPYEEI